MKTINSWVVLGLLLFTASCGSDSNSTSDNRSLNDSALLSTIDTSIVGEISDSLIVKSGLTTEEGGNQSADKQELSLAKQAQLQRDREENEKYRLEELQRREQLRKQENIENLRAAKLKQSESTTSKVATSPAKNTAQTSTKAPVLEKTETPEKILASKISTEIDDEPLEFLTEEEIKEVKRKVKNKPYQKINFETVVHKFDTINEGDIIEYNFKFVNTGPEPIEILNAVASCGCTRPSFPFIEIAPGEEGVIGVRYDSRTKSGEQKPEIEVYTNFKQEPIMLYLEGFVIEKNKTKLSTSPLIGKNVGE